MVTLLYLIFNTTIAAYYSKEKYEQINVSVDTSYSLDEGSVVPNFLNITFHEKNTKTN